MTLGCSSARLWCFFLWGACVRACVRAGECARGCLCTCDAVSHLRTPCGFEPVHALKHALMFWCGSTAPGALNQAGVFVPFFGHRYHRFSSRAYVRYLPFIRRLDPILQNTLCATLADVLRNCCQRGGSHVWCVCVKCVLSCYLGHCSSSLLLDAKRAALLPAWQHLNPLAANRVP